MRSGLRVSICCLDMVLPWLTAPISDQMAAILYLLDPYDAVPDWYGVLGYPDDIAVLRKTHAAILRN